MTCPIYFTAMPVLPRQSSWDQPFYHPPSTFDLKVMIVATVIHTGLSVAYSLILVFVIRRLPMTGALLAGLVFGAILYVINMYGMTAIFPWFSAVRDWITIVAHLVFGTCVAAVYKMLQANHSA